MLEQSPEIVIEHFSSGAKLAVGPTVVFDVFRASSVAAFCFMKGAARIIAVKEVERALEFRRGNPEWILMGERFGAQLPGFDYGNSPFRLKDADLYGKTLVQTTHAGTQNLCAVPPVELVLFSSFLNASATAHCLSGTGAKRMTFVASGVNDETVAPEDVLCAEYLRDVLAGDPRPFDAVRDEIRKCSSAARFFNPEMTHSPQEDFDLCMQLDICSVVPQRTMVGDGWCELAPLIPRA